MAMTLIEAAKLAADNGEVLRSGVIEMFAASSDVLRALPFDTIQGNALRYNIEQALPGVGFRGINEAYSESTGIINPAVEPLVIAGGDLDVDKFILDTMGENVRSTHEAMKVKALSLRMTLALLKGDSASDVREFDGLQKRISGNQKIAAGSTANGTPLSLAKLDELIDQVSGATHLIMNKTMRRLLTQAARTPTVGGNITYTKDEFGRPVAQYNDLPILLTEQDNTDTAVLPFTEACTSGTATGTSIYCVNFSDGMLTGIQNADMDVRDLGELETKPAFRTRVEWFVGLACMNGKAAARLWSISNATVTV